MSDQSVRVARILGWEYSTVSEWGDMGWWRPDDPHALLLAGERPYDADDLLAWLHPDQAFIDAIEPETGLTPGASPDDRWCVHVLYENDRDDHFTAPTLLAALEAAVLAVAEAWPQRWMTGIDDPNPEGDPQ